MWHSTASSLYHMIFKEIDNEKFNSSLKAFTNMLSNNKQYIEPLLSSHCFSEEMENEKMI